MFSPPQHGGGRVGHHVAAYVHWVPLPGVIDRVVGQELRYICQTQSYCLSHCLIYVVNPFFGQLRQSVYGICGPQLSVRIKGKSELDDQRH